MFKIWRLFSVGTAFVAKPAYFTATAPEIWPPVHAREKNLDTNFPRKFSVAIRPLFFVIPPVICYFFISTTRIHISRDEVPPIQAHPIDVPQRIAADELTSLWVVVSGSEVHQASTVFCASVFVLFF